MFLYRSDWIKQQYSSNMLLIFPLRRGWGAIWKNSTRETVRAQWAPGAQAIHVKQQQFSYKIVFFSISCNSYANFWWKRVGTSRYFSEKEENYLDVQNIFLASAKHIPKLVKFTRRR